MSGEIQKGKKTNQEILQEKVMKLELGMMILLNGLRVVKDYPTPLLERVERLITSGDVQRN